MKVRFASAALAAACVSTLAAAQMGPGTMGGPGMGQAMHQEHAMGPGAMHGAGGCPMAGAGQGPGMGGGHRMHGGMMEGGMKGGLSPRALEALDLTGEQRAKITEIRRDLQRRNHALMGTLRDVRWKRQDIAKSGEIDMEAARKLYDEGAAVRKQMFEARLDARAKIEALLTKAQREQLRKPPRRG